MKHYVVKGTPKDGIYTSLEEYKQIIAEYPQAISKVFMSQEKAEVYAADVLDKYHKSYPVAFVDGSYHAQTKEYSFGCVLLYQGKQYLYQNKFPEDELSSMRNVAGEIKGAGFIIQFCINRGFKELDIYYDYEGIEKWYHEKWKANLEGTKRYVEFARQAKKQIQVNFIKIKSHSNNHYNDLADHLAKEALGIS